MIGTSDDPRREQSVDSQALNDRLQREVERELGADLSQCFDSNTHKPSASQIREASSRVDDELAVEKAEKVVSAQINAEDEVNLHLSRSRKPEPVDDFDAATNPIHERTQGYKPPENPENSFAKFFIYVHSSWWVVRYIVYIIPCNKVSKAAFV